MATQTVPGGIDRHTFHRTRHRGFTYRHRADGGRTFYGYVPGKGRVQLQASTEREARTEWDELRGRVGKGEKLPDRKIRFAEIAEAWFAAKTEGKKPLRRSTRELYRSALDLYLLPRFGVWKVAAIDADAVAKLIQELEAKGLALSTVENYLLPLKGTLDLALRRGLIAVNPYVLLTADERPRADEEEEGEGAYEWTDDEIGSLLTASERLARRPEARFDYSAVLRVAVRTGLRLGELLGLTWANIDLDAGVVYVRQQWTKYGELTPPKTKKGRRRVPLSPEDVKYLKTLKVAAMGRGLASPESFVFAARTGTPLGHRNVQRRGFEPARDAAELPEHLTFHSLRHAFASYAAHRGVPISVLSEVMGHSHVGVTQRVYVHLYGREQAEDQFRAAMAGGAHV